MSLSATGSDSYVLCEVAGATYAVRSDDIEQLEMVGHTTPVPNSPSYVDGVTSVRGRVVPVVSLRARFGFERVPPDLRSRLIVIRSQGRSVGYVVDSAREFAAIPSDAIQPPPEGLADLSTQYLHGVAQQGDRLIFVLDVPELFRIDDTHYVVSSDPLPAAVPA
jgi:chemotaxis signal transduction protein